jgi:thioredoxin reductase (NADPH)
MDYELIIVGGGPAGLCAGIYAVRRKIKTLVLEKGLLGGQLALASEIGNYPGFQKIPGMELARKMEEHAKALGVEFDYSEVLRIEEMGGLKKVSTPGRTYSAKAVIIATGAVHRKLNVPGEEELTGRGVSYCATCDGPLFKGKTVAVIGGGNHACEDATYLADITKKVYLVHRRDELRAEECRVAHVKEKGVEFILNTVVEEFIGEKMLEKIRLKNVKTGRTTALAVDGVFVAVGVVPAYAIAKELGVKTDEKGYIKVDEKQMTNIKGVYAAGDVTGRVLQVAKAVGEGCVAALSAYEYIREPYWGKVGNNGGNEQ